MDKKDVLEALKHSEPISSYMIYDLIIKDIDELDKFIEYIVANYEGPALDYLETKLRAERINK